MRIRIRRLMVVALLLLFGAQLLVVAAPPKTVQAADYYFGDTVPFCEPKTKQYGSDKAYRSPDGWLRLSWISRAAIKVEYISGQSGCAGDRLVGETQISPLVNGTYIDANTGDDNFDYRVGSGDSADDNNIINGFDTDDGNCIYHNTDATDGRDRQASSAQLDDCMDSEGKKGTQFRISIEEGSDTVPGYNCVKDSGGNNFVYTGVRSDPYHWRCVSSGDVPSYKGLIVARQITGVDNFNITYVYRGGKFEHVSPGQRGSRTFSWCVDHFDNGQNCSGDLAIYGVGQHELDTLGTGTRHVTITKKSDKSKSIEVTVAGDKNPAAGTGDSGQTSQQLQQNAGGTAKVDKESCDVKLKDPLTWIACPIINGAVKMVNVLDAALTKELFISPDDYDETCKNTRQADSCPAAKFYGAWAGIRYVSLGVLVVIALIMVISQALSLSIFDAYTVKKVLPRLVIAVIAISLSWSLMRIGIEAVNQIGAGTRDLIYAPFGGAAKLDYPFANVSTASGADQIFALGAIALGTTLGLLGILSFAVTGLLAVAIAFIFVILRKIIISMLIVFAPLALVCYILPNTQKVWKIWWDAFSKALIVFPLIIAFLAFGRVVAYTSLNGTNDNDLLRQIVAFVGYFGPYFAIPLTFKFAGGVLGSVGGFVNDRNRGAFDRLKNFRKGQTAKNTAAMKAGNRFEGKAYLPGSRSLARGFNRTTVGLGTGTKGNFGLGVKGAQAVDQTRRAASVEQVMKSPAWSGINQNDDALMAATYTDAASARKSMSRSFRSSLQKDVDEGRMTAAQADASATARSNAAVAAVQASVGFGRPQQIAAAQQLVSTGTGYSDLADMTATLARASGGNTSTAAALAGFANAETKKTGRLDLAPGFSNLNSLVQDTVATGQVDQAKVADAQLASTRGADSVSLVRGKPTELKNVAASLQTRLNSHLEAMNKGTASVEQVEDAKKIIGQLNQLDNAKSYASVENQDIINQLTIGSQDTVREITSKLTGTPIMQSYTDQQGNTRQRVVGYSKANAAEQLEDIRRYSAPPPNINNPNNPQP